jgi:phenylpropionate dioxygenase-like ring-hydroxylating dioxygenase large terminal subunit
MLNVHSINGFVMSLAAIRNVEAEFTDRGGLPAWTYFSPELLELEKEELFRRMWQLACHVSDLPAPGDYVGFDIAGERALILRGKDGEIRAFHNVCRHRGSRVAAQDRGHCKSALVCPFHGWSYNLDGTLRAVPQARSLPPLDPVAHGLLPLEFEIWQGFVFVRFAPGTQPSVSTLMGPYEPLIAPYGLSGVRPQSPLKSFVLPVNWKAVRDVDNEGYHVPVAHPALNDLYGGRYEDRSLAFGITLSKGEFNEGGGRFWSVRHYKKLLPEMTHLPADQRRSWLYVGLFPNLVLMLYPDLVGFYQEFPLAVDKTVQRIAYYARPDGRREARASRYLAQRIDSITGAEDTQLIVWSWESMQSSGYRGMILSDLEAGVRTYHDAVRRLLPVTTLDHEPAPKSLAAINRSMLRGRHAPWGEPADLARP